LRTYRGGQYALKLIDGGYDPDALGRTYFQDATFGPPKECALIRIYTKKIREYFGDDQSQQVWEDQDKAALRHTLGHEVGHAMCLPGHEGGQQDEMCVMYSPLGKDNIGHHYCTDKDEECLWRWHLYDN